MPSDVGHKGVNEGPLLALITLIVVISYCPGGCNALSRHLADTGP